MPPTIDGVRVKPLKVIPDERGYVMEILRADEELFAKFGQVYVSAVYPGVVKGWHYHKLQTDFLCIVSGMAKVVIYDARPDSPTAGTVIEFFMGEGNPLLVRVPPLVYHGVKGVGAKPALLVNCPTEPYNHAQPDEYRVSPSDPSVPYDWSLREG